MSPRLKLTATVLFSSVSAVIACSPAMAADAASANAAYAAEYDPGEPIIVTGRNEDYVTVESTSGTKTNTPLVDVPQSISVVSREQLDDQVLRDIGDVLRYTPGASIGQGEGHRDQFTIRGQNTTADFYIDGLRDDVQYFRPLYNLERIEILKGSNALIFGRGGGGGVINRVTKAPSAEATFGSGEVGIDTFGSYSLTGDVNLAIGDVAGFRLNGFYEDLNNHRDFFGGERFAINPSVAANLSDSTRVQLSYEYVDDDRVVDRGVPANGGVPLTGVRDTFFGAPGTNVTTLQAHILRGKFEHDFSDTLSFNSTVQYADYDKLYQNIYPAGFDASANTVKLDGYRDTTQRENFIMQGNLIWDVATGPLTHKLLLGYEYGQQDSVNARRDLFFTDSQDDQITIGFTDPLNIPEFGFPAITRDRASDVEFLSFYLQDQIDIGEHFKIVGGVRYDRFEIDVVDAKAISDGKQGNFSRTDSKWSPRIGLIYKPQENVSLYASYSQSFLPRSGDQFLSLSPSSATLAPEKFENYEIGAKWDIRPDLAFTAAIFQLDRDSDVVVDPSNSENSIIIGTRTKGFEAQLAGSLLPGWHMSAGYSYLDASQRGNFDNAGQRDNARLSQVPEHMLSLWNRYDVTDRFGLGLGITHQSSQFASLSNNVKLPSYTRIDAAAYFDVSENLQLQVNVENLLDESYFPAAHNDNNISTGEPINARFTIRTKF